MQLCAWFGSVFRWELFPFSSAPAGQCSTTLTFAALFLDVAKPIVYIYPLLPVVLPLRELTPKCMHSNKLFLKPCSTGSRSWTLGNWDKGMKELNWASTVSSSVFTGRMLYITNVISANIIIGRVLFSITFNCCRAELCPTRGWDMNTWNP